MADFVLDIRTPEEVAEGRLDGALVVDFMAEDFVEKISQLDKNANYRMHCRSGGRVGKAIPIMRELGFIGELENMGGLEDAAGLTGLPIVK